VAVALTVVALGTVRGDVAAGAALTLSLVLLFAYLVVLGTGLKGRRLPGPIRAARWLQAAAAEEEAEMEEGIRPPAGGPLDAAVAAVSLVVVIVSSVVMEHAAVSLGHTWSVPDIVIGALVLGAVTSLPNTVAAIYLVRRGRGAATFSTALNSNNLNIVAGLLIPAVILGISQPSGQSELVAAWCAGLTVLTVALSYRGRGLSRAAGWVIIAGYVAFAASVVASGAS
jgi:Ca2+/Na+ antiporter